jgi:hypothetical protein
MQYMKIYELKFDEKFQYLQADDRRCKTDLEIQQLQLSLYFKGEPKEKWHPPKVYSPYPKRLEPDIWSMGIGNGAFGVTEKAFEKLDAVLEMAGEILNLPYQNQTLTICNILECIDCVDEDRSKWTMDRHGKRKFLVSPYFFMDSLSESTLFKIPQSPIDIFCWEQSEDPDSEFKACVEHHKLKGLKFKLLQEEQ